MRCVHIDRWLKIICAVASSSSIAAWAAWQNLSFFWGLIIVASQVITAINDILPYRKRIDELSNLRSELMPIYNNMEKNWYDVANGLLTEEEINDLCYSYKVQWDQIDDKYFKGDTLPRVSRCVESAEREKELYYSTNF